MASENLFRGTAGHYSQFRPVYPTQLIDFVVKRFDLSSVTTILDLGCGTGQMSLPLAEQGIPVFAVDPNSEMLTEGERIAGIRNIEHIKWLVGSDREIASLRLPPLKMCAMGASFHWMNRERTLIELDKVLMQSGGIVIAWEEGKIINKRGEEVDTLIQSIIREFLGNRRRAGSSFYLGPKRRHEEVLEESSFGKVDTKSFNEIRSMTVDDIVGFQMSTSYASEAVLNGKVRDFKKRLARELSSFGFGEVFLKHSTYKLLIATRSTENP